MIYLMNVQYKIGINVVDIRLATKQLGFCVSMEPNKKYDTQLVKESGSNNKNILWKKTKG